MNSDIELTGEDEQKIVAASEAEATTSGYQKMWDYFLHLIKTDEYKDLAKYIYGHRERRLIKPPSPGSKMTGTYGYGRVFPRIKSYCAKHHLHYLDFRNVIWEHAVNGNLVKPKSFYGANLCMAEDTIAARDDEEDGLSKYDDVVYPISIRISPYASKRDILDYVGKCYRTHIQPIQNQYREGGKHPGSVRARVDSTQERNDFIYQNRHLPRKTIAELVKDKFNEDLDYGNVGKIISLELKERKET